MSSTIGRRWPSSAPRGDFVQSCDYCGVNWLKSELRKDADGNWACPDEGDGRSTKALDRGNAAGARALSRRRVRPQSGRMDTDDGSDTPTQRTTLDDIYNE